MYCTHCSKVSILSNTVQYCPIHCDGISFNTVQYVSNLRLFHLALLPACFYCCSMIRSKLTEKMLYCPLAPPPPQATAPPSVQPRPPSRRRRSVDDRTCVAPAATSRQPASNGCCCTRELCQYWISFVTIALRDKLCNGSYDHSLMRSEG